MCNQLWSIILIQLIYYLTLVFITSVIFHYFSLFLIIIIICIFCCKEWYTFICDTALNSEVHFIHLFHITFLVLFHSFGVHTSL